MTPVAATASLFAAGAGACSAPLGGMPSSVVAPCAAPAAMDSASARNGTRCYLLGVSCRVRAWAPIEQNDAGVWSGFLQHAHRAEAAGGLPASELLQRVGEAGDVSSPKETKEKMVGVALPSLTGRGHPFEAQPGVVL